MNVIIVDDENKACTNLERMLKTYAGPEINIIGIANNTAEAEVLIKKNDIDVAFLDIEMPGENAFEFLARISPVNFEIVFVTAYDEFAIKAFRLNAADYVLKPVRISDLKASVEKLKERMQYRMLRNNHGIYGSITDHIINKTQQQTLTIKDITGIEILPFSDIIYMEANGSYSKFVCADKDEEREVWSSYPLSYYEELLPADTFFRIHRSYMLNCTYIKNIHSEQCELVLTNNTILPVSRRRFTDMLEFLKDRKR